MDGNLTKTVEMKAAPLVAIVGATASGKTSVGIELAKMVHGEIVSADSIQLYRRFDIGSAKPSIAERTAVKHHMIDVADAREDYTFVRYRREADAAIESIRKRAKTPIIVGGSGLYIKALIEGLSGGAPISERVDRRIDDLIASHGIEGLYEAARRVDPTGAEEVGSRDGFRLRRLLGVYWTSGERISQARARLDPREPLYTAELFLLDIDRAVLRERINRRVRESIELGFEREVADLIALGYDLSVKPMRSLGYRTFHRKLTGALGRGEDVESTIARETRGYAKRQLTWFKGQDRVRPIRREEGQTARETAERIYRSTHFQRAFKRSSALYR